MLDESAAKDTYKVFDEMRQLSHPDLPGLKLPG
jgi:hypothetical protein